MSEASFPQEWVKCTIGDACALNPKEKLPDNLDVGFMPMAGVPTNHFGTCNFETRPWEKVKKGFTQFKNGDVIFAKITPCFENSKAAIIRDFPSGWGAGSTEYYVLRPYGDLVRPEILFALIKSKEFLVSGAVNMSGSVGHKRVPKDFVSGYELPLPPFAEQKVIADKLDTLLAQVENTKARLERIPKILKRFRQSVLAAAVSGRLTDEWRNGVQVPSIHGLLEKWKSEREKLKSEKLLKKSFGPKSDPSPIIEGVPENWAWVNFDHIAEHSNNALKAGPFGSALKKSDCVEKGFKVYGQEQVIAGNERLVTYYVNPQKFEHLNACSIKPGDILISLVGTIGKVLVLSQEAEAGIINPRLVKLSIQEDINKSFVDLYLGSPVAHDFFRGFSHGGTMEILNLSILKELPIPLPPLEEQTEIVRQVDQLFAHADRIEQQVNNALARVNNLTQSILAKAFRGELTEQWRNENQALIGGENSAAALLEMIKSERAAVKPVKKTRSKRTTV